MDSFIENKNALIWSFDECIDRDTNFDGNIYDISIKETISIIKYLCLERCFDININEDIINKYLEILSNFTCTISDIITSSQIINDNQYILCGWREHAILLFWEKQENQLYNVGIINCGEGAEIQGYNGIKCNGLFIFKNITKERVNNFLEAYKNYYNNTIFDYSFKNHHLSSIFYFILFDKLLDIKGEVNFKKLDRSKTEIYKLNSQNIGSCCFTNLINLVYYLYLKDSIKKIKGGTPPDVHVLSVKLSESRMVDEIDTCYIDYLNWYNKAKDLIKNKLLNEIIDSNDPSYYNIYRYIIDTHNVDYIHNMTDRNIQYEKTMCEKKIERNESITLTDTTLEPIYGISRILHNYYISELALDDELYNNILNSFWEIYECHNFEPLIDLLNKIYLVSNVLTKLNKKHFQLIIKCLFIFYTNCKSFNNSFIYIIPLFILYKLKNTETLNDNIKKYIFNKDLLDSIIKENIYTHLDKKSNNYYSLFKTYLCLHLILIKDSFKDNEKFFNKKDANYELKKKRNILHYNYYLFKHIPIIDCNYKIILTDIIKDLNNNIEILPDSTNIYSIINIEYKSYDVLFKDNDNKIIIKYLKQFAKDRDITENNITISSRNLEYNFLSWYLFVNNIDDTLKIEKDYSYNTLLKYETYGYYNKDIYEENKEKCYIINTEARSINGNPGGFEGYTQKIILFLDKIKNELILGTSHDNQILKKYIIYFYLCEISGNKIEDNIFEKYNPYIHNYFNDYFQHFEALIYTYILKYNQEYIIPTKIKIKIDEKYLISTTERNIFLQDNYECSIKRDENLNEYYSSVIDFYIIQYNSNYKLCLHKNDRNTPNSISYIKFLIQKKGKYNNINLLLNFHFKPYEVVQEDAEAAERLKFTRFTGINKNDSNIDIQLAFGNIYLHMNSIGYDIISYEDLPDIYKPFYNLMTHNDIGLLIYRMYITSNEYHYFLKTLNYDFTFKMMNDNVYFAINDIDYIVHYCDDSDIYYNYGIFKLVHHTGNKLFCIYNYNHILEPNINHTEINFINEKYIRSKNIYDENIRIYSIVDMQLKSYYYNIINEYDNKYIFTNIKDVISLLINCLNYNSPYLILKNIEQIKIIINNVNNISNTNVINNKILNRLLNTLFIRFNNIYSLAISLLFYNDKIMNDYYYKNINILYKKYKICLRLNYKNNLLLPLNYIHLKNSINFNQKFKNISKLTSLLYFQEKNSKRYNFQSSSKSKDLLTNYNFYTYNNGKRTDLLKEPIIIKYMNDQDIKTNYNIHYKLEIGYSEYRSIDYKDQFEKLLKVYIHTSNFNSTNFNINITKATELFTYLINDTKTELYPIQELLMGSGKTTIITPYICILLLNNFLLNSHLETSHLETREIYIVMPESLINTSFEIVMKNLFPLFNRDNSIEILIYPNKSIYNNSLKIILISDTNFKILFLENKIDTSKKYMIYDEIDMMANPLTCELNIPSNILKLEAIDNLYFIGDLIYNNIFINDAFWDKINKNSTSNKIHNYIYDLNDDTIKIIYECYDNLIDINFIKTKKDELKNLVEYIKENILIFILTKQFNFDYGMPSLYDLSIKHNYKFKAIPYSAVDNPVMGSEFSDPILTYILTLICYKITDRDNRYRKIDKDYIVTYFENISKGDPSKINNLFNLFMESNRPTTLKLYFENQLHYRNKYNEVFKLSSEHFELIIKEILNINNYYYSKCKNISFNDLLLSKNIKNFVCFTGTAYIKPPIGNDTDLNFKPNYITSGKIDRYATVFDAIINIICNEDIVCNIYTNKNESFITDIFCSLENYDTLIDIGGIFIKYNINSFIEEYNKLVNKKEYIVYFDNGRKIFNLKTNQFGNDDSINQLEKKAFFYFSNKNITGVDAKNIMNKQAHGLVTITNNTNLRDFSQGIFRMRSILEPDSQTFDIIFNEKFIPIIMTGGSNEFNKIHDPKIRENIIRNLVKEQEVVDKQKEKVLIKQNIFALNKSNTSENNTQISFIDPINVSYNKSIEIFNKYITENRYPQSNKFNIESLNIINNINGLEKNKIIKELVDSYFNFNLKIYSATLNLVEDQVEEEIKQEMENKIIDFPYNKQKIGHSGIIYYDLRYKEIDSNQILFTCSIGNNYDIEPLDKYDILLIYDNLKNNLLIGTTKDLEIFLIYNDNLMDRYSFISLYNKPFNKSYYGKTIDSNLINYLIMTTLQLLSSFRIEILPENNSKKDVIELDKLIQYLKSNDYDKSYKFIKPELVLKYFNFSNLDYYSQSQGVYIEDEMVIIDRKVEKKEKKIKQDAVIREFKRRDKGNRPHMQKQNMKPRGGDMSNDLSFYEKYMKYKAKYITLKIQSNLSF